MDGHGAWPFDCVPMVQLCFVVGVALWCGFVCFVCVILGGFGRA